MASPRTVSDEFNDKKYQNKSVSWGEVGRDGSVRKIVTEERKTVGVEARKQGRNFAANDPRYRQTTDEAYNASYAKQGVQPVSLDDKSVKNLKNAPKNFEEEYLNDLQARGVLKNTQANRKKILSSQSFNKGLKLKARIKASRLNLTIWSVGTWLWLTVQLPFAIFNLIALGFASAYYGAKEVLSDATASAQDSYLPQIRLGAWAAEKFAEGFTAALSYFEKYVIDLSVLQPDNLFFITYIFILGFAIFQLFSIYLIYKLSFLNPLGGDWAGLKISTLILCVIGYSIPLLNLLPWFMVWTGVVWIKPK